mmetsp:Transcript_5995/g.24746  ORF Transcript_5995/g.24746 Transcript_5995/m.24746 type:complete len:417 (+) Transcript_5995:1166-2416(+)
MARSSAWSALLTPLARASSSSSVLSSEESIIDAIAAFRLDASAFLASSARALTTASRSASSRCASRFVPRPTAPLRSGAGAVYPPGSVTRASSFVLVSASLASAFALGVPVTASPAPSSIAAAAARSASSSFLRRAHACPPATRLVPLGIGPTSSSTTPLARCQWGKSSASGTGAARSFSETSDAALNALASSSSSAGVVVVVVVVGGAGEAAESRRAMELRGTSPGATGAAGTTGAAMGSPPCRRFVPITAAIALETPASPPTSAVGLGAFARVSSRTPSSSSLFSSSSSSFSSFFSSSSFSSSTLFFLSSSALAHSSPAVGGMAGGSPAANARDMMSTSSPECLATSGDSPLVTASNARGFVGASLANLSISALGITYPMDSSSALHRSSRQPCSAAYTASRGRSRSPASLFLR